MARLGVGPARFLRAAALLLGLVAIALPLLAGGRPHTSTAPEASGALSGAGRAGDPGAASRFFGPDFPGVPPAATNPTFFTLSSFNVLGAGHTKPGGNRKGWASGETRMHWAVDILRSHDVDVVGFQEFQRPQWSTFKEITGTDFGIFPGDRFADAAMQNSLAWRRDTWRLVSADTIQIPYFKGDLIRMPIVLLRNLETGQQVYFSNFHNPANARGDAQKWRDKATSLEIGMVNRLKAESGLPVVVTGDMNERDKYFCRMTGGAPMIAANGGSYDASGCHPPRNMAVDWMFGSSEFFFLSYVADRSPLVRRTTDHPVVVSDAMLPPLIAVNGCATSPIPC